MAEDDVPAVSAVSIINNMTAADLSKVARDAADEAVAHAAQNFKRWVVRTTGFLGAVASILGFLGFQIFVDPVRGIVKEAKDALSLIRIHVGESRNGVDDIKKYQAEAAANAESIEGIRNTFDQFDRTGLVSYQYTLDVPVDGGRSYWATDVSTDQYSAAIIGGWYIYPSEGSEDVDDCGFGSVVEVSANRSDPTWRLIVNKTAGCDRLLVEVVYVPAVLVDRTRSGVTLQRTPDRN